MNLIMNLEFEIIVEKITSSDCRYKQDAYAFVMEALSYTQKKYKSSRHVSGEQMLEGIKDLLLKKFGPMTITVLEYWGIKSTEDIGNIVFSLVENNVLTKTEEDCIDSFQNGYDFNEVFHHGYRTQLYKRISRMK